MLAIEPLRVDPIEMFHSPRQIGLRRLDKKVIVAIHQAVGIANPAKPLDDISQNLQEPLAISVIKKDVRPRVLQELQGTRGYEFPALIPRLVTTDTS